MNTQTLEQFIRANHTPSTAKTYLFEINNYLATNPRARYYKYMDIVKFVEILNGKYSNIRSRIQILSAVKRYYDYLLESGKRSDHPCKRLIIKSPPHNIQTHDLFSMDELKLLFNRPNRYKNLDIRDKVVLTLLTQLALTSDEIINLNLSNINLDEGTIHIKASNKIAGRTLELDRTQIRLLDSYINETRPKMLMTETNKLILNKLGYPISVDGIHSIIEPLKSMFPDRKLNPEKIRMSVISYWLNEKKIPVEEVMDISGIKWASSVMKYKRIDIDEQRELINRFHPLR